MLNKMDNLDLGDNADKVKDPRHSRQIDNSIATRTSTNIG